MINELKMPGRFESRDRKQIILDKMKAKGMSIGRKMLASGTNILVFLTHNAKSRDELGGRYEEADSFSQDLARRKISSRLLALFGAGIFAAVSGNLAHDAVVKKAEDRRSMINKSYDSLDKYVKGDHQVVSVGSDNIPVVEPIKPPDKQSPVSLDHGLIQLAASVQQIDINEGARAESRSTVEPELKGSIIHTDSRKGSEAKFLTDILNKPGEIKYGRPEVEAIKEGIKKRYKEEPALRNSLIRAWYLMGGWQKNVIDPVFQEMGVPTDLACLLIPESHMNIYKGPRSDSSKKAVGPFQIIPSTKELLKNKGIVNFTEAPGVNGLRDPREASMGITYLLKYELDSINKHNEKFGPKYHLHPQNMESWYIPLSFNNGNVNRGYRKFCKEKNVPMTLDGFLKYNQDRMNEKKQKFMSSPYVYEVGTNETWESIAREHGVSVKQLRASNPKVKLNLKKGVNIRIPLSSEQKQGRFAEELDASRENWEYPAKFMAVWELIYKDKLVTEQMEPYEFEEKVTQPFLPETIKIYVKAGQTLKGICAKYNIDREEILAMNADLARDKEGKVILPKNRPIKLPNRTVWLWPSLEDISRQTGIPLKLLLEVNPAIEEPNIRLERIPYRIPNIPKINNQDKLKLAYAQYNKRNAKN